MAYTSNYTRVNWQNDPSHSTPLGKTLLNRMDTKIYELDTAMGNIDADYLVSLKNGDAFVGFNVDETTGKITMTRLSGAKVEFDTDLEKVPLQYEVDKVNEKLILTQSDGTKVELDLSDFISVFEFTDTAEIIWDTSEDNKVKANLATNYLSDVQTAKTEAVNASKEAKSYAVGGTNTRTGEDTDNAKYYKEQAKAIVGFDGSAKTIPFDNSTNGFTAGNVQDAIEEASTKGGGGASSADKVTFSDTKSSLGATNVQDAIDKVVEKKLDKPTTAGTKGQILTVGDNNTVVWEDNEGQGALTYTKAEWNALATKPKDGTHVVITDDGIGVGGSGSGTTVVANPTDTATEALSKLKVGTTTYSVGGGSTITVDSALSDTSTNPVQNKVIKSAIDAKQDALTIDTALSTTSTNTVQNKAVTEAINAKGSIVQECQCALGTFVYPDPKFNLDDVSLFSAIIYASTDSGASYYVIGSVVVPASLVKSGDITNIMLYTSNDVSFSLGISYISSISNYKLSVGRSGTDTKTYKVVARLIK